MISADRDPVHEQAAMEYGACAFLQKPFYPQDVDRVLHTAFGLRSPTLKISNSEPDFDVAIEGATIRLAHKDTGHVVEYLWFDKPPHLRNRIVRPAIAPTHVTQAAERAALIQLNEHRLLAA
jgi:hypothetical protein